MCNMKTLDVRIKERRNLFSDIWSSVSHISKYGVLTSVYHLHGKVSFLVFFNDFSTFKKTELFIIVKNPNSVASENLLSLTATLSIIDKIDFLGVYSPVYWFVATLIEHTAFNLNLK